MDESISGGLFATDEKKVGSENNSFEHGRLKLDPASLEQGLAKLVLTIIELLRQLLERQAVVRIEKNTLTDREIEELGLAFMKLEQKMQELKEVFGLENDDLNINLGPLGNLL